MEIRKKSFSFSKWKIVKVCFSVTIGSPFELWEFSANEIRARVATVAATEMEYNRENGVRRADGGGRAIPLKLK